MRLTERREKVYRFNWLGLIIVALMCMLVACSGTEQATAQPTATPTVDASVTEEAEVEVSSETVEIEDMAGRKVTIPTTVDAVFGSNNNSSIILYTLVPDILIGWNLDFSEPALKYIADNAKTLPVLGNLYGNGKEANIEEVMALQPDIIFITDVKVSEKTITAADTLQEKCGIPVVVVHANLNNYDKAYTFLGEVLNVEGKAKSLADYYIETCNEVKEKSATITDKTTIYYARMDNGLTTEFADSPNAELIEFVGGVNIATTTGSESSGEVTIEQVLEWDPQVILVGHKGAKMSKAYELIKSDEMWAEITAVKDGKVISVPRFPFNWFDRPPSVNRILGIKWLGNALYPEVFTDDMVEDTKEFFKLYYGCELSSEDVDKLMGK